MKSLVYYTASAMMLFSQPALDPLDTRLLSDIYVLEDTAQRMNGIQHDRGDDFYNDVKGELAATRGGDQVAKREKLEKVLAAMTQINEETAAIIALIDSYKLDLLKEAGLDVTSVGRDDFSKVVWTKNNGHSTRPSRLNLYTVKTMDKRGIAKDYFVASDGINPSSKGKELSARLKRYRNQLVDMTGTYQFSDKAFEIQVDNINDYSSGVDLTNQVRTMIESSNANLMEDRGVLTDLYIMLTKLERFEIHGKQVHWVADAFNEAPLISAISVLTSIQFDILSARALALANYKSKVSTGEYSFNKIMPLAYGPASAQSGEEVEIQVMLAAFDSENQPKVTVNDAEVTITYPGDGRALIRCKAKPGTTTVDGEISIRNKSGVVKTEKWSHTVEGK